MTNPPKGPFAHTPNKRGEWHLLEDHLRGVAKRAREFGDKFGAGDWAELAGWWHDVGKVNPKFQAYLKHCDTEPQSRHQGPPHAIVGALWAIRAKADGLGLLLAGHHGGIPNLSEFKSVRVPRAQDDAEVLATRKEVERMSLPTGAPLIPLEVKTRHESEFFLRMVFSALVDADFLDTENHLKPEMGTRRGNEQTIEGLWEKLQDAQAAISGIKHDTLNSARHEIYEACVLSADSPQGFYRLTVPTGGGKTRSGIAFALKHALKHGLDRVIVAIPYTSIIDQNAQEYRKIFGDEAVLEHHSTVDWLGEEDGEEDCEEHTKKRLASENWDAPIVVTTTVQLFESLFSNRVSACRKLHNVARSVLILDEVQTLPEGLLAPILDALKTLVVRYHVTVVLSSATQPAFENSAYLKGIEAEIREVVPAPEHYFRELKRVDYEQSAEPWTWKDLSEQIRPYERCLVICNRKRDALALWEALGDKDAFHLSTLLYPAHRKRLLAEIRSRLQAGLPCRVISTQVVEAGVDLDFPVVFRAMGPLDRIVQAAGRCNREGKPELGKVVIFKAAEGGVPRGAYAAATGNAETLLASHPDLHDPNLYATYFRTLYQTVETGKYNIQSLRTSLRYADVAHRFRMIEGQTATVIVERGEREDRERAAKLLRDLESGRGNPRLLLRSLQAYSVNLYERDFGAAMKQQLVRPISDALGVWLGGYDPRKGLLWGGPDPADLVG
jgi:CRISPR-associated endonuclease/helicase Cas3